MNAYVRRDKIEMVGYWGYESSIIRKEAWQDMPRKGWVTAEKISWDIVREFYEQLCSLAQSQLGIRDARDNKVMFVFTCDGGRSFVGVGFYDSHMTMLSWYNNVHWKGRVPENFRTSDRRYDDVCKKVNDWIEQKRLSEHSFTKNFSCSLF